MSFRVGLGTVNIHLIDNDDPVNCVLTFWNKREIDTVASIFSDGGGQNISPIFEKTFPGDTLREGLKLTNMPFYETFVSMATVKEGSILMLPGQTYNPAHGEATLTFSYKDAYPVAEPDLPLR